MSTPHKLGGTPEARGCGGMRVTDPGPEHLSSRAPHDLQASMQASKRQRVSKHGKGLEGGRNRIQNYDVNSQNREALSSAEQQHSTRQTLDQTITEYWTLLAQHEPEPHADLSDSEEVEFMDEVRSPHDEQWVETKKRQALTHWIQLAGYEDVFDLATSAAEASPKSCAKWMVSEGWDRFWAAVEKAIPLKQRRVEKTKAERSAIMRRVCEFLTLI